jgi:hypothetical protein
LAIYTPPTEAPPTASTEQPAAVGATPGQALTNDGIIKLVQVKLGDSLIITKIKSSACAFDTSTDALVKLKAAGVSDAVLQAMVEAGGQPMAAAPVPPAAPPSAESPSPAACGDYTSCLSAGKAALNSSQWDQSVAYLQKASLLDPSKPDAWAEMGKAYLATGQYQNAVGMWGKGLELGGTLEFQVWHAKGIHYERGTLRLGANEISFIGPDQEKAFWGTPKDISFHKTGTGSALSPASLLGLKIAGKVYRIYPVPLGVECRKPAGLCGEPGKSQQVAIARSIDQAIARLAPGGTSK